MQKNSQNSLESTPKTAKEQDEIPLEWMYINDKYEFISQKGHGSYGQVFKARCRSTKTIVAIKYMKNIFQSNYHAKKICRELMLLQQLSRQNVVATTKLIELILPGVKPQRSQQETTDSDDDSMKGQRGRKPRKNDADLVKHQDRIASPLKPKRSLSHSQHTNLSFNKKKSEQTFNSVFIVMEYIDQDLKHVFKTIKNGTRLTEDHILIIIYNALLGMAVLHENKIVHRDIKPANLLVDSDCQVRICDLGLARLLPQKTKEGQLPFQKIRQTHFDKLKQIQTVDQPEQQEKNKKLRKETSVMINDLITSRESSYKRRQLSPHVQTRIYRAPEVILLETEYDTAVDVWSMGVVLAQLINFSKPYTDYIDKNKSPKDQKELMNALFFSQHIFHGDLCFPLSPTSTSGTKQAKAVDQLEQIYELTVHPDLVNTTGSFISEKTAYQYYKHVGKEVMKNRQSLTFEEVFPATSKKLIGLLRSMLEFNHGMRPTALDLLSSPVFDSIRVPKMEKHCQNIKFNINIPFDQDGETYLPLNYKEWRCTAFAKDQDEIDYYRKLILNTVQDKAI